MRRGKIYITLKSDLCVGDGSVYNSSIDTDICNDDYGLPYIPAKRLRGCLRECALELSDWGMDIDIDGLLGSEVSNRAAVRIGNARIEGYDEYLKEIKDNPGHMVFHPQNVLDQFAYTRTQTAIDNNTGAADPTTLRTMRVINKGLTFISDVIIFSDDSNASATTKLKDCCAVLRHMGIARTRGLGEVCVSYEDEGIVQEDNRTLHKPYRGGADRLIYTIELLDPMILKSVNGGEANTQDYIEGSKVLGLVAQDMNDRNEDVAGFFSGKTLFFSNAYISEGGTRFTEVPAAYYAVKNHKDEYRNKLFDSEANREKYDGDLQLNQMKHCYISETPDGKLRKLDVDIEERYHHRRPDDKSIGRASATADENADFYQISSISAGQTFTGMILGTANEIKKVYDILSAKDYVFMGYGRSSEYGLAKIRITNVEEQAKAKTAAVTDFAVKLEAPTIVYNENAYYSINSADLIEEIKAALAIERTDVIVSAKYLNYVTIGGYNVTWGRRKPTIEAFGAGTVIVFHSEKGLNLSVPPVLRLGERNREGFGEAVITIFDPNEDRYKEFVESGNSEKAEVTNVDVQSYTFAAKISEKIFEGYLRSEAAKDAGAYFKNKRDESVKPTISNLSLMTRELLEKESCNDAFAEISRIAEQRYGKNTERKRKKLEQANKLLEYANAKCKVLTEDFAKRYQLENFAYDENLLYLRYLEAFLMHGKYMLHDQPARDEQSGKESEDEQ